MTHVSSREFNQASSRIKKLADNGPVFITDRGKPTHVLMSMSDYQEKAKTAASSSARMTLAQALCSKEAADIALDLPDRSDGNMEREIDLS